MNWSRVAKDTTDTTHRAATTLNRSQVTKDTAHIKQHTEQQVVKDSAHTAHRAGTLANSSRVAKEKAHTAQ